MTEMEALRSALGAERSHVRGTLAGLTDEQLWTPVPPTTWAPITAMHHLALDVERWWFSAIVADDPDAWAYFEANPGGAWTPEPGTDVAAVYDAECALSDGILARADPADRPGRWPDFLGPVQSLRQILLHVIAETATHAGQLDVVRESIDGATWLVLD